MKNIFCGLLTILLAIGLVYVVVWCATILWTIICVGVFGWPMLTKMEMFGLMVLIRVLTPAPYLNKLGEE